MKTRVVEQKKRRTERGLVWVPVRSWVQDWGGVTYRQARKLLIEKHGYPPQFVLGKRSR